MRYIKRKSIKELPKYLHTWRKKLRLSQKAITVKKAHEVYICKKVAEAWYSFLLTERDRHANQYVHATSIPNGPNNDGLVSYNQDSITKHAPSTEISKIPFVQNGDGNFDPLLVSLEVGNKVKSHTLRVLVEKWRLFELSELKRNYISHNIGVAWYKTRSVKKWKEVHQKSTSGSDKSSTRSAEESRKNIQYQNYSHNQSEIDYTSLLAANKRDRMVLKNMIVIWQKRCVEVKDLLYRVTRHNKNLGNKSNIDYKELSSLNAKILHNALTLWKTYLHFIQESEKKADFYYLYTTWNKMYFKYLSKKQSVKSAALVQASTKKLVRFSIALKEMSIPSIYPTLLNHFNHSLGSNLSLHCEDLRSQVRNDALGAHKNKNSSSSIYIPADENYQSGDCYDVNTENHTHQLNNTLSSIFNTGDNQQKNNTRNIPSKNRQLEKFLETVILKTSEMGESDVNYFGSEPDLENLHNFKSENIRLETERVNQHTPIINESIYFDAFGINAEEPSLNLQAPTSNHANSLNSKKKDLYLKLLGQSAHNPSNQTHPASSSKTVASKNTGSLSSPRSDEIVNSGRSSVKTLSKKLKSNDSATTKVSEMPLLSKNGASKLSPVKDSSVEDLSSCHDDLSLSIKCKHERLLFLFIKKRDIACQKAALQKWASKVIRCSDLSSKYIENHLLAMKIHDRSLVKNGFYKLFGAYFEASLTKGMNSSELEIENQSVFSESLPLCDQSSFVEPNFQTCRTETAFVLEDLQTSVSKETKYFDSGSNVHNQASQASDINTELLARGKDLSEKLNNFSHMIRKDKQNKRKYTWNESASSVYSLASLSSGLKNKSSGSDYLSLSKKGEQDKILGNVNKRHDPNIAGLLRNFLESVKRDQPRLLTRNSSSKHDSHAINSSSARIESSKFEIKTDILVAELFYRRKTLKKCFKRMVSLKSSNESACQKFKDPKFELYHNKLLEFKGKHSPKDYYKCCYHVARLIERTRIREEVLYTWFRRYKVSSSIAHLRTIFSDHFYEANTKRGILYKLLDLKNDKERHANTYSA
ncbi:hypothetical protein BB560_000051 [Smittium megazygosporum]|uniref:Uncharacterized protein n=1 Tax=Smittium megazygosporum TaxID=133381 RepID=A0A2T9ZLF0_9FUNG|nr:hypothetical protein BB560_000051 [Smittium megazygosporum]